jgi:hypothetical protein
MAARCVQHACAQLTRSRTSRVLVQGSGALRVGGKDGAYAGGIPDSTSAGAVRFARGGRGAACGRTYMSSNSARLCLSVRAPLCDEAMVPCEFLCFIVTRANVNEGPDLIVMSVPNAIYGLDTSVRPPGRSNQRLFTSSARARVASADTAQVEPAQHRLRAARAVARGWGLL